ncbi:hybrid sensor histidine kinase/response regulator transcription factor [Gaetbulibacter aestuarii]|uniref:histidine kinase n=1 Tax=Gaetbulibacter aestuarii TaxID=1502358 RepID=A0ABW7MZV6_9FLAO
MRHNVFQILRHKLLFGLFILSIFSSFSQTPVKFQKINQSNGLSSNRITGIIKEKNGFVWIGTETGLNRYDGKEFKIYDNQSSNISSNNISNILLDSKGRIWVATLGGGLNLYDKLNDNFKVYKYDANNPESISSNQIYCLYEDSNHQIWIGTENGLCFFNERTNSFETYNNQNKNYNLVFENNVSSICEDVNGNLWIGTFGGGLNRFSLEEKVFTHINANTNVFSDFIHTVLPLSDHIILIGTSGGGLLKYDIEQQKFSHYFSNSNQEKENAIVRVLFKDKMGNLWVGTDGNGIIQVENPKSQSPVFHNFNHNPQINSSLSGNAIYAIAEDDMSNIWIGTAWNGINILTQKDNFDLIPSDIRGLNPITVLSIYKDKENLFLGTDGRGLTVFNSREKSIKEYNKDNGNSLGGDYIQCFHKSNDQILWIGTYANGLIKFNLKTKTSQQFKHEANNQESLSFNDIRAIIEDEKHNLWIASWGGGLNYFDTKNETFTAFRENKKDSTSLSNDNIVAMEKIGDSLWLGTFGGGLNIFNIKTRKNTRVKLKGELPDAMTSDNILSLLRDSKGNVWIGTSEGGINIFHSKTKKFTHLDSHEELNNQSEVALVEDERGNIWFSTKKGIYKYDYQSNNFTDYSDLAGEYHINSVFKDSEGLLYFGRSDGLVRFNPDKIKKENSHPPVKITDFKLFNKEVPIGDNQILEKNITLTNHITLKHNLNVLTFEFAALKIPFSSNCEYAIQMEGFDKTWREIGKDRTVTYTNLSPGDYTFKVKSRETGSDWGNDYRSVNITILKPFWLEWYAYVFYAFLVVLSFYLFRKYILAWEQMKTNLKLEKLTHEKDVELYNLKQQFFTNISHDIRTPITLILASINRLVSKSEHLDEDLSNPVNTIKKNGNKLLKLINELLDFRKLEQKEIQLKVSKTNIVDYCEEIYLSFKEMALQKNIDFTFKSSAPDIAVWIDKNQLEKVFYNILSNAFKFTHQKGSIQISVLEKSDQVIIEIEDKGVGLTKGQLAKIFNRFYQTDASLSSEEGGFGLGLSISKYIIELHQGDIIVESEKGLGSTFKIILKKGKDHFKVEQISGEYEEKLLENYFLETEESFSNEDISAGKESNEINQETATLLIVEDNDDIRDYVVQLLSEDYTVLEAKNGKKAFEKAKETLPDIIISDIMMPIMDGVTLTKKLKTNSRTSHIPVILLTARASFTHKIEGFDVGADDYVTKPFHEKLLKSRIRNLLKTRSLLHDKFWKNELIPISELNLSKMDEKFMSKLIKILEDNISDPDLNINVVCDDMGMSHSVIYKKIKALTNMSYIEFVKDFKLKTAKRLISEQNFSVKDACYHVGYSDRKYFSKIFKQHFGKNPSEYIKNE